MNFISHYHFYKTVDSYYNVGLVLPDLVKNFCKTHLKPKEQFVQRTMNSINSGSKMHLEADRIFHQSLFFKESEKFLSHLMDNKAIWPRKWFLNHLLCEILIDRLIMERHSNEVDDFYMHLKNIDPAQVELYLKLIGIQNYQNFTPGFERFVNNPFLFEYIHNEKIIYALGRVYQRIGINYEWKEEDKNLLLYAIPKQLEYMDERFQLLKGELKL
jgi:hypothetical protein